MACLANVTLSKPGMIIVLVLWAAAFGVSVWKVHYLKIDFKFTFFLSDKAYVKRYFDIKDANYKAGDNLKLYTIGNWDFNEKDQLKLQDFNKRIRKCDQCKKPFTVDNTLWSWYE
jgi:hypothetical protein